MREHLEQQLGIEIADPTERLIGLQIIDLIDDAGYVRATSTRWRSASAARSNGSSRPSALQQFDPIGVVARNLAECLALQLKELNRLDPAMPA